MGFTTARVALRGRDNQFLSALESSVQDAPFRLTRTGWSNCLGSAPFTAGDRDSLQRLIEAGAVTLVHVASSVQEYRTVRKRRGNV